MVSFFYTNLNQLYFGPRNNSGGATIDLPYGKGLLGFTPNTNLAGQVETVEVTGTSAVTGETFIGSATRDEQSGRDGGRKSGAELVASALKNKSSLRVQAAVRDEAEAIARARAILENFSHDFFKADASSVGLPEIRPDMNIKISGMSKTFDKTYWVSSATHSIDGTAYNTSFGLQESTI